MLTAVFYLFTNILKIIVFLFCSIKISRIFVKEITTKIKEKMETYLIETVQNRVKEMMQDERVVEIYNSFEN